MGDRSTDKLGITMRYMIAVGSSRASLEARHPHLHSTHDRNDDTSIGLVKLRPPLEGALSCVARSKPDEDNEKRAHTHSEELLYDKPPMSEEDIPPTSAMQFVITQNTQA